MNIIHFIEKIPFIELEFIEKIALPYMVILYMIDVFCTLKLNNSFGKPLWSSFIPFYNWKIVFEKCWNLKAFHEHLIIEICGLVIPLICEALHLKGAILFIVSLIDLFIACLGLKHSYEIGLFTLKAYSYDHKKYLWTIFVFDIVLIMAIQGKYLGNMSHEH